MFHVAKLDVRKEGEICGDIFQQCQLYTFKETRKKFSFIEALWSDFQACDLKMMTSQGGQSETTQILGYKNANIPATTGEGVVKGQKR